MRDEGGFRLFIFLLSAIDREHEHDFKDRILLLPNYVSIKEVVRFQIADVSGFSTCK